MVDGWIMSGDIVAASIRDNIVLPLLPEHCPLCFQCGGDIVSWLKSRAIDRKRPNGRILKRILRLGGICRCICLRIRRNPLKQKLSRAGLGCLIFHQIQISVLILHQADIFRRLI